MTFTGIVIGICCAIGVYLLGLAIYVICKYAIHKKNQRKENK